jgi:NADPH:quinone reductase-like Zn-dependent oxidoreductase
MRKIVQHTFGGPEVLELHEADEPRPGVGEVLVRVGGAGVNPADAGIRGGYWPILGDPPFTVGWDVAGTVERVGAGVTAFAVGDRVFGMPRFPAAAQAYAELVVAPADDLARTPDALTDVQAGAVPLAGLTAWQALVETAAISAGQRVLIQAAGGGVGHLAVQLAKARGAFVVASASPAKSEFVRSLGADEVLDYTAGKLIDGLAPVDVILDPLGSPNTQTVLPLVKPDGVVVSLLDVDDDARAIAQQRGVRLERILVHPSGGQLSQLAELAAAGQLRPQVAATFPLAKAGDAHRALTERPAGKIVLVP